MFSFPRCAHTGIPRLASQLGLEPHASSFPHLCILFGLTLCRAVGR